jgi:hypothetical protein
MVWLGLNGLQRKGCQPVHGGNHNFMRPAVKAVVVWFENYAAHSRPMSGALDNFTTNNPCRFVL